MKCAGIYVYNFLGFGDSDQEIVSNASSMQRKLLGQQPAQLKSLKVVTIQNGGSAPNVRQDNAVRQADPGATVDGYGVYLLAHGGATGTKPDATYLANLVFDDLLAHDVPIKKINLASCYGAGGKLTKDDVSASPLKAFCVQLQTRASGAGKALPKGMMVCAHQTRLTTFDADAQFIKDAIQRGETLDAGLTRAGQTGVVRTAFTGDKSFKQSHPKQAAGDAGNIKSLRDGVLQAAIQQVWKAQNSKGRKKGDTTEVPPLPDQEVEAFKNANWAKIMSAARDLLIKPGADSRPAWESMENYIKKKIVMRINEAGKFVPAPLAEYTDSAELKEALQIVQSGMTPASLPTSKITLTL